MPAARAAEVPRGADQRPATVASGPGVDQLALRRRARREGARDRRLRGIRRLAAPGARRAIAADLRQVPCLAVSRTAQGVGFGQDGYHFFGPVRTSSPVA